MEVYDLARALIYRECYTRECFGFRCKRADNLNNPLKTWPLRERVVEAEYSTVR